MTTKPNRKRPQGLVLAVFYTLLLSKGIVVFGQQPQAAFTASVTRGCATLRVKFTDNSTGSPSSWLWKFGVLGTSTQQNPTFDFSTPGRYTVELTVRNALGNDTLAKTNYIEVLASPTAQFSASVTGGCAPLQSIFTDLSVPGSGTIDSRIWNFDDGNTSNSPNPQHVFQNPGEYSISLKITNTSGCSDSIVKPQYLKTSSPITAGFQNTRAVTCKPPETISFTNLSVGIPPYTAIWYFGDGDTSQQLNPSHTYTSPGTFPVKLVIKNSSGCSDSVTIGQAVTINNITAAIIGPDSVCAEVNAVFLNNTSAQASNTFWYFDNTLNSSNPLTATKSWPNPGTYRIKVVNVFSSCTDSISKSIRVLGLPVSNFTATNLTACQGPLNTLFSNSSANAVKWFWDFGDGSTDSIRNPTHTYTGQGTFSVSLTAIAQNGCKKKFVRNGLVTISKPYVRIANAPAEGCVPFKISFLPGVSAVDGLASVTWNSGNGVTHSGLFPPPFTYNVPGNYTVKLFVTTTGGCSDSAVITDGVMTGTKPTANFTADRLTQCSFQPVVFTNQSSTSDKWWWHFSDTIMHSEHATYSAHDTGLYKVMLIASNNGCRDTIIKNNYIRSLPPIARFKTQIDCNSQLNVTFTDSSVAPLSWIWDFGDGSSATGQNPTHRYNAVGNYTVKLTAGNGACSHTDSATIVLLSVNPDFSASDTIACKYEQIRFRATNMNRSHIRNYRWDFGDGNSVTTNSDSATYAYANSGRFDITLTVTDINDCSYSITKGGLIKVNGPKAGFSITPLQGCAPLRIELTDTSRSDGANTLTSWKWNFGNNQTQTLNAPPSTPLAFVYADTGSFYPSLIVTDVIGCKDSVRTTMPVFVTRPKAGFINSNSNICANNSVQFSNTSKGNNLSYRWQFGDSTFSSAPDEYKTYSAIGNYSVKLIVTDVIGCMDSVERSDLVRVQNVQAAFEMSDSVTSCAPINIFFTNTSLFSITQTWDFGDGTSSNLPNPTHQFSTPGNYTVRLTARRSDNCISETTKLVRIFGSAANLIVLSPLSGCQPHTVNMKASTAGPVRYEWDFNDGTIISSRDSLISHIYTSTGNYLPVVRLRDSTGCILTAQAPDSIRIVGSDLDFQSTKSLLCGTEPILFQNSSRTPAGTRFIWDFGDGTVSSAFSPTHQFLNNGYYTIRLSSISAYGCNDTLIRYDFVKVVTQPEITIGRDTGFCGSTLVSLSGQIIRSDTLPLSWSWDFDNGTFANGQNPPAQLFSLPRTYRVSASVTNSNGCMDTANMQLVIHPIPPVDVIPDTVVCRGNTIQLRTTGAQTYSWLPAQNLSCSNCSSPEATLANDAKYYVTGTNAEGCTHTDSITVKVQQAFNLQLARYDDTLCIGESTQLKVSGADRYEWSPETGLSNPRSEQPKASPNLTTRYRVIGSDFNNCFLDTLYLPVIVYPYPEVNAGEDRLINPGSTVQLSILFSSDVTSWNWSPSDDLSCNRCPAPVASPLFNKTYRVTVSNPAGCTASDEVAIRLSCDNSNLNLPNAFTPNNDGRNDIIYPKSTGIYSIVSFVIYNRMGEVVFRNGNFMPNVQSAGWNGMFKGIPAAAGTYVYEISCICNNNNALRFRGNITLIR